jgi:hypothetical protein
LEYGNRNGKNNKAAKRLKSVWAFATCLGRDADVYPIRVAK